MAENIAYNQTINYIDLNYAGVSDATPPSKFTMSGVLAIKNALKLYVLSSAGDYYHSDLQEGVIPKILGKPLNDIYASELEAFLRKSINDYFTFNMVSYDLKVVTNLTEKRYDIFINITDLVSKKADNAFIGISPF